MNTGKVTEFKFINEDCFKRRFPLHRKWDDEEGGFIFFRSGRDCKDCLRFEECSTGKRPTFPEEKMNAMLGNLVEMSLADLFIDTKIDALDERYKPDGKVYQRKYNEVFVERKKSAEFFISPLFREMGLDLKTLIREYKKYNDIDEDPYIKDILKGKIK